MTFKDLQDRALEECGYDFSGASTPRTRFKKRINDVHRRLVRRPGLYPLLRTSLSYTFASVASQPTYGMPMAQGRITSLYERTNNFRLEQRDLGWLRTEDPQLTSTGTPMIYVPLGWFPVKTQPSAAAKITIQSTSASDTGTAYLEYLTATGVRTKASVTMVGVTDTTLVASGVVEITAFYLSTAAVGTVTLYETSAAGTALSVIPIGATSQRFLHVQLWPTPSGVITYYVDMVRELADLVHDTEDPLLPPDFHDLIWRGAVMDEWIFKDDNRAEYMRQLFEKDLEQLTHWIWNQADYRPGPDEDRVTRSRLGGWYPAGS